MAHAPSSAKKADTIEQVLRLGRSLDSFTPSPVLTEYRNNQSYAFGTKIGTSGLTDVGLYATKKSVAVVPCELDVNGSKIAKSIARAIYTWVLAHPELPLIDKESVTGFWRHVHIRETRTSDVSVTIEALSKDESLIEIWTALVPDFCAYVLNHCKSNGWTLCDIYAQYTMTLQEATGRDPFTLLAKHHEFVDTLDTYKFRRSPDSFFQPNTHTALIIYNQIRDIAARCLDKDAYLLDICCGTGTIGIYLSPLFKQVIGIDRTVGSIEDARYNAVLNGCDNCIYYAGDAEIMVPKIIDESGLKSKKVIAIVNPPRRGLYDPVLKALNECMHIDRLIYVSCNVVTLKRDLDALRFKKVYSLTAVDQFPNTEHCEVIIELGVYESRSLGV